MNPDFSAYLPKQIDMKFKLQVVRVLSFLVSFLFFLFTFDIKKVGERTVFVLSKLFVLRHSLALSRTTSMLYIRLIGWARG